MTREQQRVYYRQVSEMAFWVLLLAGLILLAIGHFWIGLILVSASALLGFSWMRFG